MKRILATAATALLLAVGCAHSHVEEHWGESYQTVRAQQVENPEASDRLNPVEGIGATTADHVTENYHERQQDQFDDNDRETLFDLIQSN